MEGLCALHCIRYVQYSLSVCDMLGIALGLGYSGDRIDRASAQTKGHSSHNLLIEGPARKWEGKEKMQPSKNNCVFRKEKFMLMGSHCCLNPPSFPSINNKTELRD